MAVSSTVASDFDLTVSTTSRTIAEVRPHGSIPMPWGWSVAALGLVLWPRNGEPNKRSGRRWLKLAPLALLLFTISCGGGGTIGGGNTGGCSRIRMELQPEHTLTVTATSSSATSTMPLTLIVEVKNHRTGRISSDSLRTKGRAARVIQFSPPEFTLSTQVLARLCLAKAGERRPWFRLSGLRIELPITVCSWPPRMSLDPRLTSAEP